MKIHKSQSYNSLGSAVSQVTKVKSQKCHQSQGTGSQAFQGHGLMESDIPVAATYSWWAINKREPRERLICIVYLSSCCAVGANTVAYERKACLQDQVTPACQWILSDVVSVGILNLTVPGRLWLMKYKLSLSGGNVLQCPLVPVVCSHRWSFLTNLIAVLIRISNGFSPEDTEDGCRLWMTSSSAVHMWTCHWEPNSLSKFSWMTSNRGQGSLKST